MHLRSPRRRAEAARAIVLGTAILTGGCEAVFGPPTLDDGSASTGAEVFDPAPEDALGTDTGALESGGVDGGDEAVDADDGGQETRGPAFDVGSDSKEDSGSAPPPVNDGECCSPAMGVGCVDDVVEACVCAIDPACCESGWDELCAKHVEDTGCGSCQRGAGTQDFPFDCCAAHEGPGCIDEAAAECVCAMDPFCCMVVWDQLCVDTGVDAGCLACIEPFGRSEADCCVMHLEPGCGDPEIVECVCASDSYCCEVEWDAVCVNEVEGLGCGSCGGAGSTGDDDGTSGGDATTGEYPMESTTTGL